MRPSRTGLPLIVALLCSASASAQAADDAPAARAGETLVTSRAVDALAAARRHAEDDAYATALRRLEVQHRRTVDQIEVEALEQSLDDALVARAAAEAGKTSQDLLASVVAAPPTNEEVARFYEERRDQIGAPMSVVADAIRAHLAEERRAAALHEFHDALRARYGARILREPLREQVSADGPARGPGAPPVTIVEFADFQCPFCVRAAPELNRVLARYPTNVRLVFRHLPLTNLHPEAQRAAEAAACVDEQSRFWPFHDRVFARAGQFDAAALVEDAVAAGADRKALMDCLHAGRASERVRRDVNAADDLGIAGTPAVFVNGRLLAGAITFEAVSRIVDDELQRQHDGDSSRGPGPGR